MARVRCDCCRKAGRALKRWERADLGDAEPDRIVLTRADQMGPSTERRRVWIPRRAATDDCARPKPSFTLACEAGRPCWDPCIGHRADLPVAARAPQPAKSAPVSPPPEAARRRSGRQREPRRRRSHSPSAQRGTTSELATKGSSAGASGARVLGRDRGSRARYLVGRTIGRDGAAAKCPSGVSSALSGSPLGSREVSGREDGCDCPRDRRGRARPTAERRSRDGGRGEA